VIPNIQKDHLRIVFMGTPDFAIPPLLALHDSKHKVELVITQPDRPKGRGRKLNPPPVKKIALKLGYEVYQPNLFNSEKVKERLLQVQADLFVVVAFGMLLPQKLLDIPALGAINIHASLLPRHRGAAPIHWAILKGDQETGVTTIKLNTNMDTGDILLRAKTPILADDTASSLHDRLSEMGGELIIETISGLVEAKINPVAQDESAATYAPMLKKKDGEIDWDQPSAALNRFIRAMDPWPGAYTFCDGKRIKVFKATPMAYPVSEPPGTVLQGFVNELLIATKDGALSILELQEEAGKRLAVKDYLCGCCMAPGSLLGSLCKC
jgi:methionyl-tRNA formyltransferase